jgi:hypothetical protein
MSESVEVEYKCLECENIFIPYKVDQKFCSLKCAKTNRNRSYYSRRQQRKKDPNSVEQEIIKTVEEEKDKLTTEIISNFQDITPGLEKKTRNIHTTEVTRNAEELLSKSQEFLNWRIFHLPIVQPKEFIDKHKTHEEKGVYQIRFAVTLRYCKDCGEECRGSFVPIQSRLDQQHIYWWLKRKHPTSFKPT